MAENEITILLAALLIVSQLITLFQGRALRDMISPEALRIISSAARAIVEATPGKADDNLLDALLDDKNE